MNKHYIPSWMTPPRHDVGSVVNLRFLDTLPEPVRTQAARLQAATGLVDACVETGLGVIAIRVPDETYVVYVGTEFLGFWLPGTAP